MPLRFFKRAVDVAGSTEGRAVLETAVSKRWKGRRKA
jgi:hypothetical protein